MSEQESGEKNGSDRDLIPRSEAKRLDAIVEVCAVHAERSFLESQAAKEAAQASLEATERIDKALQHVMRAIKRLADEQLEFRSGVPASLRDRLLLVALTSTLSAAVAAIVVLVGHR